MPAIVAHHLFGEDVYAELSPVIGESGMQRDAFILGNQGPDPLFFLKALPASVTYRAIGTTMHRSHPGALLAAVHQSFVALPQRAARTRAQVTRMRARKAYALGFLCHYLLDSMAHPLVYAQQFALADAGGSDLGRAGREIHALIETELDEYLLTTRRATTAKAYSPHREALSCPGDALVAISAGFRPVARAVYDLDFPALAFASSVKLFRTAQTALDSKREGLRRRIDYARLAGKAYLHIQALTHADGPNADAAFANNDHVAWPHPFRPGETLSASFDELYDEAARRACALVPEYAHADYAAADCAALANNVNFYGQPVL